MSTFSSTFDAQKHQIDVKSNSRYNNLNISKLDKCLKSDDIVQSKNLSSKGHHHLERSDKSIFKDFSSSRSSSWKKKRNL